MIAVIDNYDSFTYNIVQYLGELGAEVRVFRNDQVTLEELERLAPSHLVISPGPGRPESDAGISNDAIRRFHGQIPILGVCLGHQCIAHVFGGKVGPAPRLMHGKVSRIIHYGGPLFAGVPTSFEATRYHSLIVEEPLPAELRVTARSEEGEIMAIQHEKGATFGVQFHPESILTPFGKRILRNFLTLSDVTERQGAPVSITMPAAIDRILRGEHLSSEEAEQVMGIIMAGQATPAQIGAFLAGLRAKGETITEIAGFARAMRGYATRVQPQRRPLIDTCGTGGDGADTFNISTTAAFVVAGAGVAVAKHGNRSVSSRCGSADVLKALGVNLELSPEMVARCIDEVGFGFLFAPLLHPAMKHAIGPRREMGVRTVFNILGPLTNPAGASLQIIGVYAQELVEVIAHVLRELGASAAYVVHNSQGMDELCTAGTNFIACLQDGMVRTYEIPGETLGLMPAPLEALRGGDPEENARITRAVLAGERGPRRDVVLLNAGAALHVAGAARDFKEGIAMAAESIDAGRAAAVLEHLVRFTGGAV